MRGAPLGLVALTMSGALLGHEIGYLTDSASLGHGYLEMAAPVALIAIVAVVWRVAVNIVRQVQGVLPSVPVLAATQSVLYLAFEISERLVADTGTALWSLPVLAGLVAQLPVAWLALKLLGFGTKVLESLAEHQTHARPFRRATPKIPIARLSSSLVPRTTVARGPPTLA